MYLYAQCSILYILYTIYISLLYLHVFLHLGCYFNLKKNIFILKSWKKREKNSFVAADSLLFVSGKR